MIPYAFDRTSGQAQRLQPSSTGDGGFTLRFFNEPLFSYVVPDVAYGTFSGSGSNLRSVDQYDFVTGQYLQLINLDTLVGNLAGTYTGGLGVSAGPVERLIAFFGGTSQDRHFYLVVFDRSNPGSRHLLDTSASTIDGVPANTILNFKIHAANIDRSGRYVTIYPTGADLQAPRSAARVRVGPGDRHFTPLPLIAARSGGHDAFGYGVRVNQDCCTASTWDAAQWQFRSLATPLTTCAISSRRCSSPRRSTWPITRHGTTHSLTDSFHLLTRTTDTGRTRRRGARGTKKSLPCRRIRPAARRTSGVSLVAGAPSRMISTHPGSPSGTHRASTCLQMAGGPSSRPTGRKRSARILAAMPGARIARMCS